MSKEFDHETLTYEARLEIHDALAETTLKHINGNRDLFSPLEFNPAAYVSQRLEEVHLPPAPVGENEADGLARIAAPELYPFMVDELDQSEGEVLRSMRLYLENGENVHVVIAPHLQIDDLPEFSVALGRHMGPKHWQKQNGEIISRGVTTIGAFGMAASEVVEKAGHVFLSFPRTDSIEKVKQTLKQKGIDLDIDLLIETNNRRMRKEIMAWKKKHIIREIGQKALGKSLQLAWEGSTPHITYENGDITSITVNGIHRGTYRLIKGDRVLPVVLWSDPENPRLKLGPISRIHDERSVADIHKWQCHTLARELGLPANQVRIQLRDNEI